MGLVGHSAASEIAELTAGLFDGVDVVISTGYSHFSSVRTLAEFTTSDSVRAGL